MRAVTCALLALACAEAPEGADPPTGDGAGDRWPDPGVDWAASVTVVHEGRVLPAGATLAFAAPPAGIDDPVALALVLTNRTSGALDLDPPGAWLDAPGFSFLVPPPGQLDPGATITVEIAFSSVDFASAATATAALSAAGVPLTLEAQVPPPLRAVIVGDGGYTLVSDDAFATVAAEVAPDGDHPVRTVSWGAGRFFRAGADAHDWNSVGVYQWSDDGEVWHDSTAADDFWVTDCAFGLDQFFCLRSSNITWSLRGPSVLHEPEQWSSMLNAVVWTGTRFVAVGRDGRRVRSADGRSWADETAHPSADEYADVAVGEGGVLVAVGGNDRYTLSVSNDGGATWADQSLAEAQYARLNGVAYANGWWLASGDNNAHARLLRSADAQAWTELDEDWRVLGAVGGWFVGVRYDWSTETTAVARSRDGVDWSPVFTTEPGRALRALAAERWSAGEVP